MKINKIELKNFKFHHALNFEIKQQNCLIYGENGTGKSSIYEALYSNFYFFKNNKIATKQIDIREKFIHRDYRTEEELEVNVLFDNKDELNRKESELENKELLDNKVIYFANERLLRDITENNFYSVLKNILTEHFPKLKNLPNYSDLKNKLRRLKKGVTKEIIQERINLDAQLKSDFYDYIPMDSINSILKDSFNEEFEIEFEFTKSSIEDKKLTYPSISIGVKGIDDRGDFQNHFNEAKLKLIGIAIYFALAKKYETNSDLKLLVLDDFLTSLDMANRKLIVQYILENFEKYQKIILTHNIQFYNLIIRLLDMKNEKELWDIKRLFLSKISDDSISEIRDDKSFLDQAKERLESGDLQSSGNFLRKEFERIVHEFEMLLELGKVEDMSNILDILKEPRIYYSKPNKTLESFIATLEKIFTYSISDSKKLSKIANEIEKIKDCKIDLNRAETLADGTKKQHSLLLSFQKTNFYNGIILNSLSHDDVEIEAYRKECINIIELLSNLNKGLMHLKGMKYK